MVYKAFAKDVDSLTQIIADLITKYRVIKIEEVDNHYEVRAWRKK